MGCTSSSPPTHAKQRAVVDKESLVMLADAIPESLSVQSVKIVLEGTRESRCTSSRARLLSNIKERF